MQPQQLKQQLYHELFSILDYWMNHAVDTVNGGFYGKIDNNNDVYTTAPKGAVLNARILWTFAAAYNLTKEEKYLAVSTRSFAYIRDHFIDKVYGGVFWTIDYKGHMLDSKKQIYALAFCIYGLSEYHLATNNNSALNLALDIYKAIEEHSYDKQHKGYFEAFARNWQHADDLRLSAKDANEKKTMNTHLHIIEAYANLYKVYPFQELNNKITELLALFDKCFINHTTYHLKLFFDEQWKEKPDVISYGHDIEAAWLLLQCAEIINDKKWITAYKSHAVNIAAAATEGLDTDGGLWYEYEPLHKSLVKEKHWWPQAEAIVGFYNAYALTGNNNYLEHAVKSWQFIQHHIIDTKNGEWFWGVNETYAIMQHEDKAGLWKCPYHNSRACMELMKRI